MSSDFKVITCQPSDLFNIVELIKSQNFMYGINLHESGWQDKMINTVSDVINNSLNNGKIFGLMIDNKLQGFQMCMPAKYWPFWYLYIAFYSNEIEKTNKSLITSISTKLLTKCLEYSESLGLYECFYTIRDHGTYRAQLTFENNLFLNRYDIINLEVIKPYEKSRNMAFNEIFPIIGHHKKTITVRQLHLKKEFRPAT